MGWIKEALHLGELQITVSHMCPICNPTKDLTKPTKLNACEVHRWVSKEWFEAGYDSNGNVRRRSSY
jgi:hypothetical protein